MTASSQYSYWARYLLLISTSETLQFQEGDNITRKLGRQKLSHYILDVFLKYNFPIYPEFPQIAENIKKIKKLVKYTVLGMLAEWSTPSYASNIMP